MRILWTLWLSLLIIDSGSAAALTVAEAVDTALRHNPQIARSLALLNASDSRTFKAKAPFWPSLEINYSYWRADHDVSLDSRNLSSTAASARYNLFNGGSDWFRLVAAENRRDAVKWQHRSVIADTILATHRAYIEVLRAEQTLATAHQSVELLLSQYQEAELRLEQGLIARNDLLRIAVDMATAQQSESTARSSLVISRQELARVLGRPLDDEETLAAIVIDESPERPAAELQEEMLKTRSELKYLHSQLEAQAADRKAIKGDLLPDIDLSHSYERFGNHAYPESSDVDYESNSTTMLQASWLLFSGFDTRHELATRKHEILALKEEVRATEDLLKVQLHSSLEAYRLSRINLETARTSVVQATENYRVNEKRYKAQIATTVDLLDAQEFLTRARNEEIKAQYDLYTAKAAIHRVLERGMPGLEKYKRGQD